MTDQHPPLGEVHILAMPLGLYREASEHIDELMREFTLIRERDADEGRAVPGRLLELVETLNSRFSGFTVQQESELQAAVSRGEPSIDLLYRVPVEVGEACMVLAGLLDEADEFCRQGQDLLTLATPPGALAFRRWFLDEFVRQLNGAAPTPWPAWSPAQSAPEGSSS